MKLRSTLVGLCALAAMSSAVPAKAINFIFNTGPNLATGTKSVTATDAGFSATVTGYTFGTTSTNPTSLHGMDMGTSFFAKANLRRTSAGLGVAGDSETDQVDTNGVREALRIDFTGGAASSFTVLKAFLGMVDNNDTLGVYGIKDNVLTRIGFGGASGSDFINIFNPGSGFESNGSLSSGNYVLEGFNPGISSFSSYLFTTTRMTGDGYALAGLTVSAVPEPELWAMLIVGFGLVGMQMRRRSGLATVTA